MTNSVSHYFGEKQKKKKKWNGNKSNVILQFQTVAVPNISELLTLHQNMNAVVSRVGEDVSLQPAVLCRASMACGCRVGPLGHLSQMR